MRSEKPRLIVQWFLLGLLSAYSTISHARAEDPRPIRVVVWDEQQPAQKQAYENFLGNAIAEHLSKRPGLTVKSVKLDDPEQGLSAATLDKCDVLIWWGHVRHGEIKDETAKAIVARVKAGKLALVALHSAHWSRPFIEAMNERSIEDAFKTIPETNRSRRVFKTITPAYGQPKSGDRITPYVEVDKDEKGSPILTIHLPNCCFPSYREDGKPSHVKIISPDHPIARGLPRQFDIPATEMYADPFHVPKPDATVFEESWDKGETFRSGLVWKVGKGTVVYFRPGHETHPVYRQAEPLHVLENTVRWLGSTAR